MAMKGKGYLKTTWAFQERPVASAKLNDWDDRIESALVLLHYLLNQVWGGGDGVLRNAADELEVQAAEPAGLSVTVHPGYAFIGRFAYALTESMAAPSVQPPSGQPRIDLVVAELGGWTAGVVTGEEDADPEPPEPPQETLPLAELYLRPGMNHIANEDDGNNGYIIDVRTFL